MSEKADDDDGWIRGFVILTGSICVAVGIGYICGPGLGWISFGLFFLTMAMNHKRKS